MRRPLTAIAGLALATVTALAATACSGNSTSSTGGGEASGTTKIVLVAKADASDYWTAVKEGALQAGQDLGVTVEWVGPATETEPDKQLQQLDSAINGKPAGIGFAPQDGAQAQAPTYLQKAQDAGIPVVAFDTPVADTDIPIATIASDNKQIGAMAAEKLSELIGGQGTVGIIAHGEVGTAADRRDGFIDWMKANAPGVTLLPAQNGNSDQAESRTKAAGVLTANPDLAGFFGTDDDSVIAIAEEVQSKGSTAVVIGVDASPDEIRLVKEGKITGGITQNPGGIGYQAVKVLVDAANGTQPAEKNIVSPAVWYTKDNLDSAEVVAVLGEQ
ncbi:MAG: substrate-binding domain-containing protein [Propionibacteriaceae bacterium]|jgi:ribose transport system substrate-binding protein|nr:substrate-binding domain-containing protein [Propionibacteriaceae bacterium]